MKIKALIVDDEPLARERFRSLLEEEPEIEIVGECADGRTAVAAIQTQAPDLLFLDIQMPELDGFGVLREIRPEAAPVVVFVTAHDQFALRAFEVHAVDYLLKPFDRERFQTALRHAVEQVKRRERTVLPDRLKEMLAELKAPAKTPERLPIKIGGKVIWVKLEEVDWMESADNYVELHVGAKSHLLRETLSALEARLPAGKFVRISRSTMVNASRVREVQRLFYGGYTVMLENGTQLTLSRRYRDKLQQFGLSP
jgi:two-component system, LytTR family, response regulator